MKATKNEEEFVIEPDKWIKKMAQEQKMIEPFAEEQVSNGVISFGPSSYGYDIRLHNEFKLLNVLDSRLQHSGMTSSRDVIPTQVGIHTKEISTEAQILDPKNLAKELFTLYQGEYFILPSHSLCLGRSLEYFRIPRDILAICFGKSTYARCGVLINITPLESEWEGYITIAISNISPLPVKLYAGEGIAQVLFLKGNEPCSISYADRKGKYQAQKEITGARVKQE